MPCKAQTMTNPLNELGAVPLFHFKGHCSNRHITLYNRVPLCNIVTYQVQKQGDIMGEIREEVQSFYMRDYVEEKVAALFIGNIVTIVILTSVASA